SIARHVEIQKFYEAITRAHEIKIDHDRLPDIPRLRTDAARARYRLELDKALKEQLKETLQTINHQAMLTREEQSKREAAEMRANKLVAEAARAAELANQRAAAELSANLELEQRLGRAGQTESLLRRELTAKQ